jgi:uncharacterized protein YgbK (DUF1537 family)
MKVGVGMKLTIIADDFTGSNDTGVQFAKKGLRTVVTTNLQEFGENILNAEVAVIDTESRFDSAPVAFDKVNQVSKQLSGHHIPFVYKKLDSTFKGNVGAEIEACMDGFSYDFAILIPALPSNGRQTIEGHVIVNGTQLHLTEVANDPKTPVKKSYIPDILSQQMDKRVHVVFKPLKGYDVLEVVETIKHHRSNGVEVLVFDAYDNEDLKQLAAALRVYEERFLMVGTAGLAEFLTDALQLKSRRCVLSIIGSVSDVTRQQIEYASNHHELMVVDYDIDAMFDETLSHGVINKVVKELKAGGHVVVRTAGHVEDVKKASLKAEALGLTTFEMSDRIAEKLGDLTSKVVDEASDVISGLYITGGDTLIKIAKHLGIEGMVIVKEVLPAIPMGRFISEKYQDINIVTKAGGFGKTDAFDVILKELR